MKYTIDRFEGDFVVCELENGKFVNIPRIRFPHNSKEGDILIRDRDKNYIIDKESTKKRSDYIQNLFNSLKND